MAIPEPFQSKESLQSGDLKTAFALQIEIDSLIDIIEKLTFIKANDPEYLRESADHIIKLSRIVNQILEK